MTTPSPSQSSSTFQAVTRRPQEKKMFEKLPDTPPTSAPTSQPTSSTTQSTSKQPPQQQAPAKQHATLTIPANLTHPSFFISTSLADIFRFTRKPQLTEFEFHQIIGSGTFGVIHIAQHKESKQFFAIKKMNKDKICRLRQAKHIKFEREMLLHCQHPRIVKLFETMQDAENIYLIIECCTGGDFFTVRQFFERLRPSVVRYYAAQIVTAFAKMHSQRIVYRDLKPENLLLDEFGQLKITDFGFTKELNDLSFTLCGTPEYIAPELVVGAGHDKGVDWWALGVFIYEMLVGNPPFFGDLRWTYEAIVRYKPPLRDVTAARAGEDEEQGRLRGAAGELIRELLRKDKTKRLGCLHGGTEDVKKHPFFAGINWNAVEQGLERAPILPPKIHPLDIPAHVPEPQDDFLAAADDAPAAKDDEDCDPGNFRDF